jgi:hypothetical protein
MAITNAKSIVPFGLFIDGVLFLFAVGYKPREVT